jgi:LPXTG-motif cell wall-anchored protein
MTQAAILITQGTVQLVAGILAVILIAIVLFRRKGKKKSEEDEF